MNTFHCEIDEYCNKVVKKHFPNSICHGDIKTTDFTQYRGTIDVVSGGFPCQPFSNAGQRKGTADDRHLWPEMLRAVREIQPRWVVGENVRGFVNWSQGLVFDQVQADLEAEGYEVLPFLLPACGIGAPHQRDRVWIVANANGIGFGQESFFGEQQGRAKTVCASKNRVAGIWENVDAAHTNRSPAVDEIPTRGDMPPGAFNRWEKFPTQPPVCGGNDGFPDWVDRLATLGNAIVPQVALQIFEAINEYELL